MPIDPLSAIAVVKGITGILGATEEQQQFKKQKALNDLRTNLMLQNIEANEQRLVEADVSNNFRIQKNALLALGESEVQAAVRNVSGKSVDQIEQDILTNEAAALNKSRDELQFTIEQLTAQEEQILFNQELFNLQEPDLISSLLNVGLDTASTVFLAGQRTGASEPLKLGG